MECVSGFGIRLERISACAAFQRDLRYVLVYRYHLVWEDVVLTLIEGILDRAWVLNCLSRAYVLIKSG